MRLEGLGQLTKSNNLTGKRNRNLPASSIVPQPSIACSQIYRLINEVLNLIHYKDCFVTRYSYHCVKYKARQFNSRNGRSMSLGC
jgi:hypothetical protein